MNKNVFWDTCEVHYFVDNVDRAHDLGLSDLPAGWIVSVAEPAERPAVIDKVLRTWRGYRLTFEVQGAPAERDGALVRIKLQEMGLIR